MLHFRPTELMESLGVSRARIVAAIGNLEQSGEAIVKVSGVRQGYRLNKDPGGLRELAERMAETFLSRETADLDRLRQVLGLSSQRGCLTAYLTKHFGEILPEPCGHCDRCRGVPATTIKRLKPRKPNDDELDQVQTLVAQNHPQLSSPRQLTRFLCGMTSPATTRARLTKNDSFGLLADLPFAEVLTISEVFDRR